MLEGPRLSLRPLDRRHLERTRAWANDIDLARLLDRARPVTDAEHEQWFEALRTRPDCVYFAIETLDESRHIGNVWLWDIDPRHRRAELRIVIGERQHLSRGSGTEAIRLACDYAFERLNLHRIYACVLSNNPRAARAFEKAGFLQEGVLKEDRWTGDRYTDVLFLARLR